MFIRDQIDDCERVLKTCNSVEAYRKTFPNDNFIQTICTDHDIQMQMFGFIRGQIKADITFLEYIEKEYKKLKKQISLMSDYLSEDELSEVEEKIEEK